MTEVLHRIEVEEKEIKGLEREATHWKRAQCIREYIAAAKEKGGTETDSTVGATGDRIDPLTTSPRSIIDDKKEVIGRLESFHRRW